MLVRARIKTGAAGCKNVEFVTAVLGNNELPENQFDRVVLVTVLGEIPNRSNVFEELFCALKPGGILAVVEIIFDPHFQSSHVVTDLAIKSWLS